jgi:hypothetical protein
MDGLGGLGLAAKISGLWPKGWGDMRTMGEPGTDVERGGPIVEGEVLDPGEGAPIEGGGAVQVKNGPGLPDPGGYYEDPNMLGTAIGMERQWHDYDGPDLYGDEAQAEASKWLGDVQAPPGIGAGGGWKSIGSGWGS